MSWKRRQADAFGDPYMQEHIEMQKKSFTAPEKSKRVKAAEIKRQYMDTLASIYGQWMGQKQQGILYLPVKARIFRRWG